ncbi:hypothetical protein B0H11DRAFT_1907297 [Mycena galericulata]|nr:hypothetical protein B0H11DRAFT_1907297 [Mycena galericulata]
MPQGKYSYFWLDETTSNVDDLAMLLTSDSSSTHRDMANSFARIKIFPKWKKRYSRLKGSTFLGNVLLPGMSLILAKVYLLDDDLLRQGAQCPVTVWVVGEVASQYGLNEEGFPARRVALHAQELLCCGCFQT